MKNIKFLVGCIGILLCFNYLALAGRKKSCEYLDRVYKVCKESIILVSVETTFSSGNESSELYIFDEKITSIASNAFKNLTITSLIIEFKKDEILRIEQSSFSGLPKLKKLIILSSIIHLRENLFKEINTLAHLQLTIDGRRQTFTRAFPELEQLTQLDIVNSNFNEINHETFYNIDPWISNLTIKKSQISTIKSMTFEFFNNLTYLNLASNGIVNLQRNCFLRCFVLETLILSSNKLKKISNDTFSNLYELKKLCLDENSIQEIEYGAFVSTTIGELSLNNNQLKHLEPGMLYGMINLRILELQNNQIATVQRQTFNGMHLELLNLENNNLKVIRTGGFYGLIAIELKLSNNGIVIVINDGNIESDVQQIYMHNESVDLQKTDWGSLKPLKKFIF